MEKSYKMTAKKLRYKKTLEFRTCFKDFPWKNNLYYNCTF